MWFTKNWTTDTKKIKSKNEEKTEKEKVFWAYNKQYKQRCHICGKYGHRPGDHRYPEYKKENESNKKREKIMKEIKSLMQYVITVAEKGIWVRTTEKENIVIIKDMRKQKKPLMGMKMTCCYVCLQLITKNKM